MTHGFFHQNEKGHHHLQSNVQVYKVRIPVLGRAQAFEVLRPFEFPLEPTWGFAKGPSCVGPSLRICGIWRSRNTLWAASCGAPSSGSTAAASTWPAAARRADAGDPTPGAGPLGLEGFPLGFICERWRFLHFVGGFPIDFIYKRWRLLHIFGGCSG